MSKTKPNTFETSLQKLEQIVITMEEDSLPLEDLLKYYETGTSLVKDCEDSLKAAHKQLEVIRKKSLPSKASPSPEETSPDDEIRLF